MEARQLLKNCVRHAEADGLVTEQEQLQLHDVIDLHVSPDAMVDANVGVKSGLYRCGKGHVETVTILVGKPFPDRITCKACQQAMYPTWREASPVGVKP